MQIALRRRGRRRRESRICSWYGVLPWMATVATRQLSHWSSGEVHGIPHQKKRDWLESNHGAKEKKKKNFLRPRCVLLIGVTPYCAPLFRVRYFFATLSYLGAEPVR